MGIFSQPNETYENKFNRVDRQVNSTEIDLLVGTLAADLRDDNQPRP